MNRCSIETSISVLLAILMRDGEEKEVRRPAADAPMDIVKTFGTIIANQAPANPERTRAILLAGYRAQLFMLNHHPDKRLPESRRFIAQLTMRKVIEALSHPENSAAISLFVPSEPLQAAGITPYSVETLSAFLAGTHCEQAFLERADAEGFPETMCSYHRTFDGALDCGLVPAPRFTIYTNVACDGNMVTFPRLQEKCRIPGFFLDVPYDKTEEAVQAVAGQIRTMVTFIGDTAHTTIDPAALIDAVARGQRTGELFREATTAQSRKRLPSDMTSEMYAVFTNRILLGSSESERYAAQLMADMAEAPASNGLRLVWLHLIPNMQKPVCTALDFTDDAYITACDLATDPFAIDIDPSDPYDAMARRLVYSAFNGSIDTRVERALALAEQTNADGAVLFTQWGCKSTLGAAPLIKQRLEQAGLSCLVLDGDGCNRANASDGQTATRLNAFLEMLRAERGRTA